MMTYDFIHIGRKSPDSREVALIIKGSNGVKNIFVITPPGTNQDVDFEHMVAPDHMSEDEKSRVFDEFIGVHLHHCCSEHGCKYGEENECPVAQGFLEAYDKCDSCYEDEAERAQMDETIGSFCVMVDEDDKTKVSIILGEEHVLLDAHEALAWAKELTQAARAADNAPLFVTTFDDDPDDPVVLHKWPELTYVVQPSELPGTWVAHCLEVDVVGQGEGPEEAFLCVLQAAGITIELDRRQAQDPLERCAPDALWPPERLQEWSALLAKHGENAAWVDPPEPTDAPTHLRIAGEGDED